MTSRSDHLIGSYVPSSQIRTCPPPYSPFGISPANLKYSSGWSSTWTARWFFFGSGGMPLGTAHETPTPSFSSRKSQCSRRAWCSWTTNRGALVSLRGTLAPGSGVRLKSRLASYSASLRATMKRLGHGRFLLVNRHRDFPSPRWKTEPRRQARAPPARPSGGCECSSLPTLLLEAHLETDPLRADLARLEWAVRCEAFELRRRVGAALEHLERRLRRERADSPEVHLVDLALDVGVGCVLTPVLDHRRPAGAKDAVPLGVRAM